MYEQGSTYKKCKTHLVKKLEIASIETKTADGSNISSASLKLIIGSTTFSRPGSEVQSKKTRMMPPYSTEDNVGTRKIIDFFTSSVKKTYLNSQFLQKD